MKVVEVLSSAPLRKMFAIEVAPGKFWGESWTLQPDYHARTYPSWLTKEKAEAKLKELKESASGGQTPDA